MIRNRVNFALTSRSQQGLDAFFILLYNFNKAPTSLPSEKGKNKKPPPLHFMLH